ncbi:MAG TPA: hypothetical protein VHK01_08945 [Lacipirellulaceae bacterium]|jgi:hypothetical protein|nr:hypothetical protein [Lacipirellulaceae bacterium]
MKHVEVLPALLVSALLGASLTGCRDEAASSASAAAARAAKNPTPEESFQLIVDTFRRGLEDVPIGFVMREEGGQSMMVGKREFSHELIKPTKEGEPYRATITVITQSRYSMQRSKAPEENGAEEQTDEGSSGVEPLGEQDGESGLETFDSDLVSAPESKKDSRRPTAAPAEDIVERYPVEGQQKYDLVYENGRWSLITKLDPETEKSIRYAFERAGVSLSEQSTGEANEAGRAS